MGEFAEFDLHLSAADLCRMDAPVSRSLPTADLIAEKKRAALQRLAENKRQRTAGLPSPVGGHGPLPASAQSTVCSAVSRTPLASGPDPASGPNDQNGSPAGRIKRKREEALARREASAAARGSAVKDSNHGVPPRNPLCQNGVLQLAPSASVGSSRAPQAMLRPTYNVNLELVSRSPDTVAIRTRGYCQAVIDRIRSLPDATFHYESKTWRLPLAGVCEAARAISSCQEVKVVLTRIPDRLSQGLAKRAGAGHLEEPGLAQLKELELWEQLMDFQRLGVEFGVRCAGKLMIADEMGLGKTVQALALALVYFNDWPLLILCPSSLRLVWRDAVEQWLGVAPEQINVVLTGKDHIAQKGGDFQTIIADESHFLKNRTAQRSITACALLKSVTPVPAQLLSFVRQESSARDPAVRDTNVCPAD